MTKEELNKEIIDILDNVMYWETCPENYKARIEAIIKQLTLTDVVKRKEEDDTTIYYFPDGEIIGGKHE